MVSCAAFACCVLRSVHSSARNRPKRQVKLSGANAVVNGLVADSGGLLTLLKF